MRFQPGNQHGVETRWKPGQSGNPKGRPAIGASIRNWLNVLAEENEDGSAKYTMADIRAIAEAPEDSKKFSATKRAAARQLIEIATKYGKDAREALSLILDRTEGRPAQSIHMHGHLTADPAVELTEDTLQRIRQAADNGER